MRIVDVRERSVEISRYNDPSIPSGGLTTSIVAVETDHAIHGRNVVGYGFSSIGRFAQSGLIRERFAPRLLRATPEELRSDTSSNVDPFKAWGVMMKGEKPGGHGERCIAVGTLDMAIWDAASKIAGLPLYRFLAETQGTDPASPVVPVYAGGGYLFPNNDVLRLQDEVRAAAADGFHRVKIKVGSSTLPADIKRIEAVLKVLPAGHVAVDAMNAYDAASSIDAARALREYGLWWFEDVCDPLDFETQAAVAKEYPLPIAAGEALFSAAEAKLLSRYGGLRSERDILLFDPVHTYGVAGYLQIIREMETHGWKRSAFWPHGGHLFSLHLAAALGLGGSELNPTSFFPFGGLTDGLKVANGSVAPPEIPGVGFENKAALYRLFSEL